MTVAGGRSWEDWCSWIVYALVFSALIWSVTQSVPALPNPGQIVETSQIELSLGGCAANTAYDLAKLGVNVCLGRCIGEDPFGDFLLRTLEDAEVQTTGVSRCSQSKTATSAVINVEGDDRRLISVVGANRLFKSSMIPEGMIESAAIVHIGGFLLLDALESELTLERLRKLAPTELLWCWM